MPAPARPASSWAGASGTEQEAGPPNEAGARDEPARGDDEPLPPLLRRADLLAPLAIFVLALVTRLWRLGTPDEIIPLDETHYVEDARQILDHGSETHFVVHPPVGKWFIAAGMRIFGRNSAFGWRFFGALLGALGVLVIYFIAMRLWRSRRVAIVAALLLGIEGLWFVQSRVAMLDIYAAFFALLALWLLLEDRARTAADHRGIRWWRVGAGGALGLAFASKWGALPIFGMLGVLALAWEWRRLEGRERRGRAMAGQAARIAGAFLLLPAALYVLTYLPWFADSGRYTPPACQDKGLLSSWTCYQREMARFHQGLERYDADGKVKHPYFSEAWSWPWIGRPVAHYYETTGEGDAKRDREIIGLPNPAIWWAGFAAILPLAWWSLRDDPVAALVVLGVSAFYLPYLVAGFLGRPNFLFYAAPLVPFLVLAVTHVLQRLMAVRGAGALVLGYLLIALVLFVYFLPVLTAMELPHEGTFGWRTRMWFSTDCTAAGIKHFCWI